MKKLFLFSFVVFFMSFSAYAQKSGRAKEKIYSFGLGIANEDDIGNFGLSITNDLKIYLIKRFGVNPRVNYFQSLGLNNKEVNGFTSYSAVFVECGLFYSFVKNSKVEITINAGPSGEFGSSGYSEMRQYDGNGNLIDERFNNEYIHTLGYYTDLEFSWGKRKKLVNTIAIKAKGFYIYPEFIGIVYKLGLRFK